VVSSHPHFTNLTSEEKCEPEMKKKRQREIHVMEMETELLHLRLGPSSSQLRLESHTKNSRTEPRKSSNPSVFSINDLREYNTSPRLRPLIEDEKPRLPPIDRFLTLDTSDEDLENESESNVDVSRMLFIPLRGEHQISLSQTSTESESVKSVDEHSTFQLKRKTAVRQALGVITNRQRRDTSSQSHRIDEI
jgi:hypothetical protein